MALPSASPGKSCTFTRTGLPLGWYSRPPFLNCPTYEVGRRARCQWCWPRPDDPLPNRTCSLSEHPALQRLLRGCRGWLPRQPFTLADLLPPPGEARAVTLDAGPQWAGLTREFVALAGIA